MELNRSGFLATSLAAFATACGSRSGCASSSAAHLLNMSYDPTRDLCRRVNAASKAKLESNHAGAPMIAIGGWAEAHRTHFAEGAIFDQITMSRAK